VVEILRKFGSFSFSRFGFILETHTQRDRRHWTPYSSDCCTFQNKFVIRQMHKLRWNEAIPECAQFDVNAVFVCSVTRTWKILIWRTRWTRCWTSATISRCLDTAPASVHTSQYINTAVVVTYLVYWPLACNSHVVPTHPWKSWKLTVVMDSHGKVMELQQRIMEFFNRRIIILGV